MKKLIFLFLIISSSLVHSEEIKLSCDITVRLQHSNGAEVTERYVEVFEVTDHGEYKSILPSSDNFGGVSTAKFPFVLSITDFSDKSKWDIFNQRKNDDGSVSSVTIRIDRNVGRIWYSSLFETNANTSLRRTGTGNCVKVDATKKKF